MAKEFELSPVGKVVWEDRYAKKDELGNVVEKDVLETFFRVATAIASKEKDPKKWAKVFYDVMVQSRFCPAGRVLAHSGTHYSQLLNCFVLPFEKDSLESIMTTAKNMAITQKFGGGTGFSYSKLRPAGCYITGVNGRSCGTIGFVGMMSTVSEVIEQGGCLTDDTLINTKKGLLYFRELITETEQGWYPQDLTLKSKDGDKPSERFYVNGLSDTLNITTDLGIGIKGTLSHKLEVFTEKGFVWKELKDIKKGDYLVSKMNQYEGQLQVLDTSFKKDHHNCIIPEHLPEKIEKEFAFFLGYYLGKGFSGSGARDYRNGLSIPDNSYLKDEVKEIFYNLFGSNISITDMKKPDDQSETFYITNKIVKAYLKDNGLLKPKCLAASIPQKIRCSPRDIIGSFLYGLFEADGSICYGYPCLNTSSRQLAKEVQVLLLGVGVPCNLFKKKKSFNSFSMKDKFCVKVFSFIGLENWNKIVSPHEKSRFYTCKSFKPDLNKERSYILPFASYWLKDALEKISMMEKTPEIKYLIKSLRRYVRGGRTFTLSAYYSLSKIEVLEGLLPSVEDLLFPKVISTELEEDYTFDMEVKESHSYIANSLISHNSRRGANMGCLEIWHPDIWEFIAYKNEHNWDTLREFIDVKDEEKWRYFKYENLYKWQMYNVSVAVNDEFIEALEKDEVWPFMWEGKEWELYKVIYKMCVSFDPENPIFKEKAFEVTADCDATAIWKVKRKVPFPKGTDKFEVISRRKVKASEVWDQIAFNAWSDGCPGIINLSEMRRMHNLEYTGTIEATNPCLHGDTLVAVADGRVAVSIKQLSDEGKDVPVYCRGDKGQVTVRMMRNPRITGYNKKLLKVNIENGHFLRVTESHKFVLSDGSIKKAVDLREGDSLSIMSRLKASFDKVLKHSNSKSQDYFWINSTDKKDWVLDHRLIYNFFNPKSLSYKDVIHHKDRYGLNNSIDNLKSMSKEGHDQFHSIDMVGDKNPMRRAVTEWSDKRWSQYKEKMSVSTSGKKNGRFCGVSNDDLFDLAMRLTERFGRKLTVHEWEDYAKEKDLPSQFSGYRTEVFGTVSEFLNKAALMTNSQGVGLKNAELREFRKFLILKDESDLDIIFDKGVKVRKRCENCNKEFIVMYGRREQCFCSHQCFLSQNIISEKNKEAIKKRSSIDMLKRRIQQINVYNDLKREKSRDPLKKEIAALCKERKIPFRLVTKRERKEKGLIGTFCGFRELKEAASSHNHRVVSVEKDISETVYNGTVDQYHNFYVGHFEEVHEGCSKFVYVNNMQCGEQPLPANSVCNLSSIILPLFVNKSTRTIDFDLLKETVHAAVRFSDNVIDNCEFPLPEVGVKALEERRVGLGTMGIHDMLIEMHLGYDTQEGRDLAEKVLEFIRDEAYRASIELAKEKGPFPSFDKKKFLNSGFIKTLPKDIRDGIREFGIRNGTLLTQAPTGSISAFLSFSSGCEPWYSLSFTRNTRLGSYVDGCGAYIKWEKEHPNEPIPTYFKGAAEIAPIDHVKMMIVFSKYVDSAVSKTVNLPNQATVADVKEIFDFALANGVKGLTVFRDGSKEGVLIDNKKKIIVEAKKAVQELQDMDVEPDFESRKAPRKRGGKTVGSTIRVHMQKHNLYISVNRNKDGDLVEVFATVGENKNQNANHTSGVEDSWAEGLAKMISLALRAGVDVNSIIRNLKNIPSDKPVFTTIGDNESSEMIPSPPHAIARAIEEEVMNPIVLGVSKGVVNSQNPSCVSCGSTNTIPDSPTCYACQDCGYKGCG